MLLLKNHFVFSKKEIFPLKLFVSQARSQKFSTGEFGGIFAFI
jgi:hypothetical protein